MHYQNRRRCRVSEVFGKALKALDKEGSSHSASAKPSLPSTFYRALVKDFAECQEVLDKEKQSSRRRVTETTSLTSVLGECLPANTRQRIRQWGPHARFFAE
jgi:hypothetical protein